MFGQKAKAQMSLCNGTDSSGCSLVAQAVILLSHELASIVCTLFPERAWVDCQASAPTAAFKTIY